MYDVTVNNAVMKSLIIEEVKHVFDGWRQDAASAGDTKQSLKQVVNVHLQSPL